MQISVSEIIKLVANALSCEENTLSIDSRIGKHENWDSLGQLAIMTLLEEKYHFVINENNIDKLLSIRGIYEFIANMQK